MPVLLLTGAARYLFTPLAMAVVFAMLASYLLSRTLVPTMAGLPPRRSEVDAEQQGETRAASSAPSTTSSTRLRSAALSATWACSIGPSPSRRVLTAFMAFSVASLGLVFLVGEDFFPTVDSGQIGCMPAAPAGTRIEETESSLRRLEREIRAVIPAGEIEMMIDNIGIPNSWPAIAQGDIPTISSADGEILISLNKDKHAPTHDYEVQLRKRLPRKFPGHGVFLPARQHHQPDPQLRTPRAYRSAGRRTQCRRQLQNRRRTAERIARIPGAADVHVHQVVDQPEIRLNVDRVKAAQLGLTQHDVTSSMLISLSGNGTVAPNYWMNWSNGVNYNVGVQTPQYRSTPSTPCSARLFRPLRVDGPRRSWPALDGNAFVAASPNGASQAYGNPGAMASSTQLLSNLVSVKRDYTPVIVNHYNVCAGLRCLRERGPPRSREASARKSRKSCATKSRICRAARRSTCADRCQTMQSSFFRLGLGMIFAVVLVYLLMTVNFQSWLDPFIILTALPRSHRRHSLDALRHRHHPERPLVDGRHHVHGSGNR